MLGVWGLGVGLCVCVLPNQFKSCSNCEVQQLRPTTIRPNHEFQCVCVTPNPFNKSKVFAIIQHLSTAMSAPQQCLNFRPSASLPLSMTQRLCTAHALMLLPHPATPNAHAPTPVQGPLSERACYSTRRWACAAASQRVHTQPCSGGHGGKSRHVNTRSVESQRMGNRAEHSLPHRQRKCPDPPGGGSYGDDVAMAVAVAVAVAVPHLHTFAPLPPRV